MNINIFVKLFFIFFQSVQSLGAIILSLKKKNFPDNILDMYKNAVQLRIK
jgi:hypothetical protein